MKIPNSTKIIGLTGGIGSGKSLVEKKFIKDGLCTLDLDEVVRNIYLCDNKFKMTVADYFSLKYNYCPLLENNIIDKKFIADKVFKCQEDLDFIEKLIHPKVFKEAIGWIDLQVAQKAKLALIVVPLLFESKFDQYCDYTIAINAAEEIRIERLMSSRNWTLAECKARIQNQASNQERNELADFIIENNGSEIELEENVFKLINKLVTLAK